MQRKMKNYLKLEGRRISSWQIVRTDFQSLLKIILNRGAISVNPLRRNYL